MKKTAILSILILLIVSGLCFGQTPASLKKVMTDELKIQPDPNNPIQGTWFFEAGRNMYYVQVIVGMRGTTYFYSLRNWKRQSVYNIDKKGDIYTVPSPLGGDVQVFLDDNLLTLFNITYERYED